MNAIDKLIGKIKEYDNPTVIGLDPRYDILPDWVAVLYGNTTALASLNNEGISWSFMNLLIMITLDSFSTVLSKNIFPPPAKTSLNLSFSNLLFINALYSKSTPL